MQKPVLDRKTALAGGFPRYFTGKPCKNGHVEDRYTVTGACLGCLGMHRDKDKETFERARAARLALE